MAFSRDSVEAALVNFAPDLVAVDALHPEAAALVSMVRAHASGTHVVVFSAGEREEEFLAWVAVGISGYLGLDASADDLLSAVRRVEAGEVACPPRLTALLLDQSAGRSGKRSNRAGLFSLTSREQEIAGLLAEGLSNKLIACRLGIALPTVKNHVYRILEKLDCRSRVEAAACYRKQPRPRVKTQGDKLVKIRVDPL